MKKEVDNIFIEFKSRCHEFSSSSIICVCGAVMLYVIAVLPVLITNPGSNQKFLWPTIHFFRDFLFSVYNADLADFVPPFFS